MAALCQRAGASCGACCGLYNRAELSRAATDEVLGRRTRALAAVPRTPEAFRAAATALARAEAAPLFEPVRVCSLLGFVEPESRRIGCLGHPAVTGGVDLRSCGAYDVPTCEAFLCPSHAFVTEEEAELLERATAGDFYLYGLAVTDAPFVRAVLAAVAAAAARPIAEGDLAHAPFRAALAELLALKEALEPGSDGLFGAFHPARWGEDGEGPAAVAGAEAIVAALGGDARSGNDEEALLAEAERRLAACAAAFPRGAAVQVAAARR